VILLTDQKINFKEYFIERIPLGNGKEIQVECVRKNFDSFVMPILEREGDKEQLDNALDIYYKVLDNINNIELISFNTYPAYNLKEALGEDLFIIFAGEHLGTQPIECENKTVPAIVVGSRLHRFKNKDDLYEFWVRYKPYILHEIIHLQDYKRVSKIQKSDITNNFQYYNNPLEFNAFYLEVAHHFYNDIRRKGVLSDRETFIKSAWDYVHEIQPDLKKNLTDKMLYKWNKRFYQLYDELKKEFKI
jgi:hypothetical protein